MDKGIRVGVNAKFKEMLPQLAALGGKMFRREILDWTVENYGVTMASASTHYNHSFQTVKEAAPELVAGLGRPEGKNNGGRKRKAAEVVITGTVISQGVKAHTATHTVTTNPAAEIPEQTVFTVKKKSDGSVIAEGVSFEDATALVAKAKAAKKSSLYWV